MVHAYPLAFPIAFVEQSHIEHRHGAPFRFPLVGLDADTPVASGIGAKLAPLIANPLRLPALHAGIPEVALASFGLFRRGSHDDMISRLHHALLVRRYLPAETRGRRVETHRRFHALRAQVGHRDLGFKVH